MNKIITILFALLLSSCVETAVVSSVAATGAVVAQERSAGQAVDDVALFWKIKHLYLNKNAQDLLAGVSVKVIEGRVHLTGKVDTPEARIDAVRLAWQPRGVQEVINEIRIDSNKTIKEIFQKKWIAGQIRAKLLFTKEIKSINYSVDVVEGVVYLMGIAQSTEELNKVTNIASKVKGVKKVISHVYFKDDSDRNV